MANDIKKLKKEFEMLKKEVEEMKRKDNILARSVLNLYRKLKLKK